MNCKACYAAMSDLLLDPMSASSASARAHIDTCNACHTEFTSLQSTFALLDTWKAPAPSLYFDQKLAVLLREEQTKVPASWLERMRAHLLFNTGRQFRPAVAGVFAVALLLGGTFARISSLPSHADTPAISATVRDLQILDKNDQAIQQMDQLLQEDQPAEDNSGAQPIT